MNRRDFFKRTLYSGVTAGAAFSLADPSKLFAGVMSEPPVSPGPFDLIAVKGGEPAATQQDRMNGAAPHR